MLRPLVSVWFQVLLTRLTAVLFTVQSPYLFTIGHRGVFSLGRWSGRFHTEFHEIRTTLERLSKPYYVFADGAITLFGPPFQVVWLTLLQLKAPTTPGRILVWALPISLAATHGINGLFLFLQVLRCFSSLRSLLQAMN